MRTEGKGRFVAAGAVVLVAIGIAVAHAPFARSALMSLGGCPLARSRMTVALAAHARRMALDVDRGTVEAPARPALGFVLDSTTHADVQAWATREHVACDETRADVLECTGVPPASVGLPDASGTVDELTLQFDARQRLVTATAFRSHLAPEAAAVAARTIVSSLTEKLGPTARRAGDFGAARFSAPPAESISTVRYRYSDYVADVTAMNAPSGGPSIREHYMSARD